MTPAGLPHSEIPGSTRVNRSPRLIAACHVLHRLPMPRHPPLALNSLSINHEYLKELDSSTCIEEENSTTVTFRSYQGLSYRAAAGQNDQCTNKPQDPKDFVLLYYLIIKEQCLVKNSNSRRFLHALCKTRTSRIYLLFLPTRKKMVEVNGIEPMTSCVQGRRSPS